MTDKIIVLLSLDIRADQWCNLMLGVASPTPDWGVSNGTLLLTQKEVSVL